MSIIYKKCPKCNSNNVVSIVYGEPSYELYLNSEKEKVFLGGCCISMVDGFPEYEYHCKDCGFEYNRNDVINNIYSNIRSIKGYVGGFFEGHKHFEIDFVTGKVFYNNSLDEEENKLIKEANTIELRKLTERLKKIKILNWKKYYDDKGILDGTQWSVAIDVNGRIREKHGSNMFPKEWKRYCKIISHFIDKDFS